MVSMTASYMQVESHKAWKRATKKISKRKYGSDYHRKGLYTLPQISIDSLDDVLNECLLDLGLFPVDRKICSDALLDIWVYVEKLPRRDAFAILSELAEKNLLNLTGNPSLLGKHELLRGRSFDAQILCILTGRMEENDWYDMNFPETEALLLLFTSTDYFLPPFLRTMKKLRFLMISNCGTNKATVQGLDVLSSLTQLKSVRLERLNSPLGGKQSIAALQNIEKLSLSFCEGFENIPTFTSLQDLHLDHNNNLEELPLGICNIPSIVSLSITNCHQLQSLPYDFGKMSNLKMLRLSALPCLEQLPASIGKLEQLEYLDISLCESLKDLPKEIGQLKTLRELDMRECSSLMTLPSNVCELSSLKLVTCDETIGKQWFRAKNTSIPELSVQIVEAYFSLDWLEI